jgi:hypothetical protein
LETGEVHFKWIWGQTTDCACDSGVSLGEIEKAYASYGLEYQYKDVLQALLSLSEKDIIECSVNNTELCVVLGLSQIWLQKAKNVRRVLLEEHYHGNPNALNSAWEMLRTVPIVATKVAYANLEKFASLASNPIS